ncbi:MAG TPA: hypothetical protein VFS29_11740 [Motilibacteraceae bacterium]|nr:hypothetical protein [Motilibacteraceae bacterium]
MAHLADRTSQDPHRVSSRQASVEVMHALLGAVLTVAGVVALLAVCSLWLAPLRVLGDERHAGWVVAVMCALVPALAFGGLLRSRPRR